MTDQSLLAGVDLAWHSTKNPSAIAIGALASDGLTVLSVHPAVFGIDQVLQILQETTDLSGVAIDAPLIINNIAGQRCCEREIGVTYSSRNASCHPANTTLYPNADSVNISNKLSRLGFAHLNGNRWQIECYPHPALIEIFGLDERLKYKKGRVQDKKLGQIELGRLIGLLSSSPIIKLNAGDVVSQYTDPVNIASLKGQALKSNEDALDAIICLYIAALHACGGMGREFGNTNDGYIWVPQRVCI